MIGHAAAKAAAFSGGGGTEPVTAQLPYRWPHSLFRLRLRRGPVLAGFDAFEKPGSESAAVPNVTSNPGLMRPEGIDVWERDTCAQGSGGASFRCAC